MTATRILIRRGTAAEWTAANPVLLEGEQGYETDTGKLKIGDGVSTWSSLSYNFEVTTYTDADVDTHLNQSTATNGQVLSWNGTDYDWTTLNIPTAYTDSDVDTHLNQSTAVNGQFLSWNGADYEWANVSASYTDSDVDTHLNVSGAANNQVLSWNGNDYDWTTLSIPSAYTDSDVDAHLNVSGAANGQVLSWNGSDYEWANVSASYTDSDVDAHLNSNTAANGQVLSWNGSDYEWATLSIPSAYTDSDVDTHLNQSTAANNQVLSWNGSDYAWTDQSAGSSYSDADVDTHLNQSSALDGKILSWNGTDYEWTSTLTSVYWGSVVIGDSASALDVSNSVAVGRNAQGSQAFNGGSVAVGIGSKALGIGTVSIGNGSGGINAAGGNRSVFIGTSAGNLGSNVSGAIHLNASAAGGGTTATESSEVVIQTDAASLTYDSTSGWVFTEDRAGTPITYDISSLKGTEEKFATLTNATGTVVHDCDTGQIFYHTTPSANWTINLTNLGLTAEYKTTVTIFIDQGASAYIPTALQIGGAAQTILWQGGSQPTGTVNGTDMVEFNILNDGGTYIVMGELVSYS